MRRRALLAGAVTSLAGLAGCTDGGSGTPTPTSTPTRTSTETASSTPTATATRTPATTVSPERLRGIRDDLGTAALKLDEQVRMPTITGPERSFDANPIEDRLASARTALDGVPADRASAVEPLAAFADAVDAGLAAAKPYVTVVGGLREALSLHSVGRFGDAGRQFESVADPLSTATTARGDATTAFEAVPTDRIDREALNYSRLQAAITYLGDALTGIEALAAGGPPLETGIETFGLAEQQFASESYQSAARTYRDAAGSFDDAVDGFATSVALSAVPEHVRKTLDTHRCRADAYLNAAEGMRTAAEKWETDRPEAGSAYDAARAELATDCVVTQWGNPGE